MVVARILGLSLLTACLGAALGIILFNRPPDSAIISLCFACVGGIAGSVAGAAREIVIALRERPEL